MTQKTRIEAECEGNAVKLLIDGSGENLINLCINITARTLATVCPTKKEVDNVALDVMRALPMATAAEWKELHPEAEQDHGEEKPVVLKPMENEN